MPKKGGRLCARRKQNSLRNVCSNVKLVNFMTRTKISVQKKKLRIARNRRTQTFLNVVIILLTIS